jgi:probable F420-dependent oxidoreductase
MKIAFCSCYLEPESLAGVALAAEAAGFDRLTVSDHLVFPKSLHSEYPYLEGVFPAESTWPDPWVTIAHLAAVTTTLQFVTSIYIATLRPPIATAKAVATAAVLSGNRVALGVGTGWMREEFRITDQEFDGRSSRLDEIVEICRAVWAGGWVEHHGPRYDFEPLQMKPVPTKPIPIWGGGDGPHALRRAARLDGFIGPVYDFDQAAQKLAILDEERNRLGTRDRDDYTVLFEPREVPSLDDCRRYEELGATELRVAPWETYPRMSADPGTDVVLRSIDDFATNVLAHL